MGSIKEPKEQKLERLKQIVKERAYSKRMKLLREIWPKLKAKRKSSLH